MSGIDLTDDSNIDACTNIYPGIHLTAKKKTDEKRNDHPFSLAMHCKYHRGM